MTHHLPPSSKTSKSFYLLLLPLLAIVIWSFLAPNGIRAAIANNAWSLNFVWHYFAPPEKTLLPLPPPPPTHPHAAVMLAQQALRDGNSAKAEELLLPLVQKGDPLALNDYAAILVQQQKYAQAATLYQSLGNALALEQLARDTAQQGLKAEEILTYRNLYALDPEKYTSSLAVTLKNDDQLPEAMALLEKALSDYPTSQYRPSWFYYQAEVFFQRQQYPEAEGKYRLSIAADPTYTRAWRELGFLYLDATNEPLKAVSCFEELLQLESDQLYVYYHLGSAYEQADLPNKALHAYRSALALDPSNPQIQQAVDRLSVEQ